MKSKGFTLIELSIVLVIMGLLAVGAVSGRSLIKAADLKAVISNMQSYRIAIDNFKQQYEGLPGDLKNATSFWTSGTSNGNGDGKIGNGTVGDDTEVYYAWQQLSLSLLVSGVFTSSASTAAIIGTNVPASKSISGAGYSLTYLSAPFSYTDDLGRSLAGNYLVIGKNHATDNYLSTAALVPEDAAWIDIKVDDGTPDYGSVIAGSGNGASGNCTTGSAPNIEYDANNTGIACLLAFTLVRE